MLTRGIAVKLAEGWPSRERHSSTGCCVKGRLKNRRAICMVVYIKQFSITLRIRFLLFDSFATLQKLCEIL